MLRAFGCALRQLFYVLTVLWCRQTIPPLLLIHCPLSVYAICIKEIKWLLYEWEQYGGLTCLCRCGSEKKKRKNPTGEVFRVVDVVSWGQRSKSQTSAEGKSFNVSPWQATDIMFFHFKLTKLPPTILISSNAHTRSLLCFCLSVSLNE